MKEMEQSYKYFLRWANKNDWLPIACHKYYKEKDEEQTYLCIWLTPQGKKLSMTVRDNHIKLVYEIG